MNSVWAVCLPRDSAAALGTLRCRGGILACETADAVWLHGTECDDALEAMLKTLPGYRRFQVLADRKLCAEGRRVPSGYLPDGSWRPLRELLPVVPPTPVWAGQITNRVPLTLVRSTAEREPALLLTAWDAWCDYAALAPQVRLDRWHFAVAPGRRVLVCGTPLPPLPGERLMLEAGIACPCGWEWSPRVDAAVLRKLFELDGQDVLLLGRDGSAERIREGDFVRARRTALGQTAEVLHAGPR